MVVDDKPKKCDLSLYIMGEKYTDTKLIKVTDKAFVNLSFDDDDAF
jgi:hypothetical protein